MENILFGVEVERIWNPSSIFCKDACLASSLHDDVAAHKMYQPWKEKMSVFLIIEKARGIGIPPGPRKIKLYHRDKIEAGIL